MTGGVTSVPCRVGLAASVLSADCALADDADDADDADGATRIVATSLDEFLRLRLDDPEASGLWLEPRGRRP